jgi:hypothetical protein
VWFTRQLWLLHKTLNRQGVCRRVGVHDHDMAERRATQGQDTADDSSLAGLVNAQASARWIVLSAPAGIGRCSQLIAASARQLGETEVTVERGCVRAVDDSGTCRRKARLDGWHRSVEGRAAARSK